MLTTTQEWKRTGYVWEQYDADTGEGRRRWVRGGSRNGSSRLWLALVPRARFQGVQREKGADNGVVTRSPDGHRS